MDPSPLTLTAFSTTFPVAPNGPSTIGHTTSLAFMELTKQAATLILTLIWCEMSCSLDIPGAGQGAGQSGSDK